MLKTLIYVKRQLENDIQWIESDLISKRATLDKVYEIIRKNCDHVWVDDWIDLTPDRSKRIIYCQHCELNKK